MPGAPSSSMAPVLAFGSDAPVESPNPFWGLHAAVTRRRADGSPGEEGWYPEQRLQLDEALHGFTTGPAYATGMEKRIGRLAPGFLADLLVLDRDIFHCDPEQIKDIRPAATMIGGAWVWRAIRIYGDAAAHDRFYAHQIPIHDQTVQVHLGLIIPIHTGDQSHLGIFRAESNRHIIRSGNPALSHLIGVDVVLGIEDNDLTNRHIFQIAEGAIAISSHGDMSRQGSIAAQTGPGGVPQPGDFTA